MVESKRAQKTLLFRAINTGHFDTVQFGKLQPERAYTTACAIDEECLTWAIPAIPRRLCSANIAACGNAAACS